MKKSQNEGYTRVSKGVYKNSYGTYRTRRVVNGRKYDASFTNKTSAIKYYNSLA